MASAYAAISEDDAEEAVNVKLIKSQRIIQFRNVVLVGVVFMLLSSASQTASTIEVSSFALFIAAFSLLNLFYWTQTIVIDSVHDHYFNGTSTMGYKLLSVLNGKFLFLGSICGFIPQKCRIGGWMIDLSNWLAEPSFPMRR